MRKSDLLLDRFIDYEGNPILSPTEGFQSKRLYNPSVVRDGERFVMVYRAEADDGLTGRIGLAESDDGIHYTCREEPILVPGEEFDKGGCEDPRLVKIGETYWLTYVGNSGKYHTSNICMATSTDLFHWRKWGPLLEARAGAWNSGQLKAGAILAEKVNGRYVMYFMGEGSPWRTAIGVAFSEDLVHWCEPRGEPVLSPREGYFDTQGVEPGPPPILLKEGILLIYNGWASDCIYKPAAALFSKKDPTQLLWRAEKPILEPSRHYGLEFGEGNHCVAEGLVRAGDRWYLYYGAADRFVCLATCEERKR